MFRHANGTDQLNVNNWFAATSGTYFIETVEFADGTVWNSAALTTAALVSSGTAGNDTMTGTLFGDTLLGLAGNDTMSAYGGANIMDGGDGDDVITGTADYYNWSYNTLLGGAGNDTLSVTTNYTDANVFDGGPGTDSITGSNYRDTYRFNLGNGIDNVSEVGGPVAGYNDKIVMGAGIAPADITVYRSGNTLVFRHANGTDQLNVNNWFASTAYQIETVEFADGTVWSAATISTGALTLIAGTTAADTLTGTAANEYLQGLDGNDTLDGMAGNDRMEGGAGDDTMRGGAGDDTYLVGAGGDVLVENFGEGLDTVISSVSWSLAPNIEDLVLTGTAAVNGTGNVLGNRLWGNAGANVLDGGAGADTLRGGAGDDVYVIDDAADQAIELAGEGSDRVEASVSYTLGDNVENLTLTGSAAINGTGNALGNVLTGNSAANVLTGGLGDDTYVVSTGDSVVEAAGGGTDTVQSGVSWTLAADVENLTLTGTAVINGTGNALDNVLTGNSAANVLAGGAGNDTYVVGTGDTVTESANGGTDTVQAGVTWTLSAEVENLLLTGTTAINGTGNALANVMVGNIAANTLNGGAGVDTMIGGAGNDSYVVDYAADAIIELANEGTDSVSSNVSYTLSNHVENLTLTGTTAINGTGNALDNLLIGNSAVNTLAGGGGNDTYVVTSGDVVVEAPGEGMDTVQAGITWTLANTANVENLTLTGTSGINGTGNALDNVLTGNSGANTLTGGAGNDTLIGGAGRDTMVGGAGDDTYVVDVANDTVTELLNEGTDTVLAAVTLTVGSNVENLTLTGTAAINATGNADANVLTGNGAANTLSGLAGNDTYDGGAGNDTLTDNSTTSSDVYRWGVGQGNDAITDAGGADRIEIATGVTASQITLTRAANDLLVGITGAVDVLTVKGWYTGTVNRIEEIRLADGSVINAGTVAPLSLTAEVSLIEAPEGQYVAQPMTESDAPLLTQTQVGGERSLQLLVQSMSQFGPLEASEFVHQMRTPDVQRFDLAVHA